MLLGDSEALKGYFLKSADDRGWNTLSNVGNFWMDRNMTDGSSAHEGQVPYYNNDIYPSWSCYFEKKALRIGIVVDLDLIKVGN